MKVETGEIQSAREGPEIVKLSGLNIKGFRLPARWAGTSQIVPARTSNLPEFNTNNMVLWGDILPVHLGSQDLPAPLQVLPVPRRQDS